MNTKMLRLAIVFLASSAMGGAEGWAEPVDLSQAALEIQSDDPVVANAGRVLVEEIAKRTGITWPTGQDPAGAARVVLAVQPAAAESALAPEGFRVVVDPAARQVAITGADPRGVLFGVGHVLRKAEWRAGNVSLPVSAAITTAPKYPIRGHQIGYRHRANTYDKWDVATYEQYIRDMAIFGANCIETIPSEGGEASDHMPLSREEMNTRLSEICAQYGLDFWMWIPATFDLTDPALRAAGLEDHEAIYAACPRVDHVFFPGGDPGDNHPREVMAYLVDVAEILKRHHPDAMIWLSMQGYNSEKVDYVYTWLEEHDPRDWLAGLVAGPGSPPIPATRARLAAHYRLRHYPDITHTVRSQYPVSYWDPAYARTHTREPVNVQPRYQQFIHNTFAPYLDGFLAYSDGAHDDANKAVWSQLGWNPDAEPAAILEDYARVFLSAEHAKLLANGLLAFEQNWEGPLALNGGVTATMNLWRAFDNQFARGAENTPNWRMQMFVMRAYLDALTRERMLHENELETQANAALLAATDSAGAIADARAILAQADDPPAHVAELRANVVRLAEALWESIGFQGSVERYNAAAGHRGAILDYLDVPLNDRWWLEDEFEKVRALPDESARMARLRELANWENPGDGSYYDDIGNIGRQPHVVFAGGSSAHPVLYRVPNPTYWAHQGGFSRLRQAWLVTLGPPHALRYQGLDPQATYTLRLTGVGEAKPQVNAVALNPTIYGTEEGAIKEFPVPNSLIQDGTLEITFEPLDERHLNWRVQSRLSEAWLLKDR
jgi:hypothetical protein